ncbi:hypothetical protein GCM10023403_48620 [Pseudonocardia benzenivorans]
MGVQCTRPGRAAFERVRGVGRSGAAPQRGGRFRGAILLDPPVFTCCPARMGCPALAEGAGVKACDGGLDKWGGTPYAPTNRGEPPLSHGGSGGR